MSESPKKDISNTMIFHHYKQIFTIGNMISDFLDKFEAMGFLPTEVYYAYVEHLYYMRFSFEDGNQEEIMKLIDKEVFDHMLAYRKENPKEKTAERHALFTCSDCKVGKHDHPPKTRCGKLTRKNDTGVNYYCECHAR